MRRTANKVGASMVLAVVGAVVAWAITGPLDSNFDPDATPTAYVGMPAVSSHLLYTGNTGATINASSTRLYAIDYDSAEWTGNMHSYPLTSRGAVVKTDDWVGGIAAKIDVQNGTSTAAVPVGRYIFTRNDATNVGTPFRWSGLSVAQRTILDPTVSSTDGNKTSDVLDYIRGARDNEGTGGSALRVRTSTVGDIIHSTPQFCPGTAQAGVATCGGDTVFVGTNAGHLHAINAATGTERWAYIPSMLMSKLPSLKNKNYIHQYFVDGRLVLGRAGANTVLVGGLGGGGKGLFALNVTNAVASNEGNAASKFMWEITNTTTTGCSGSTQCFANLGYTYGQPVMATLQSGTSAVIMSNGYAPTSGRASLFLINTTTGALIQEIVMPDDGTPSAMNGLSSPTVITDFSGRASYAYAGDLMGNLWKIQLSSPFTVTKLFSTTVSKVASSDPTQSITMAPGIIEHPLNGYIVCFVTGRELMPEDDLVIGPYSGVHHYAYGIWDSAGANTALLDQELTERVYTGGPTAIRVRTATANEPNWGTHLGWRTKLPITGERVIGDGAGVSGTVFMFMSYNPTITATPPTPDGENWWMQLNAVTGGDNGTVRFDLDNSGAFEAGDQMSVTVGGAATLLSPVGRNMGGGRRSQLTALDGGTFNVYQANYDKNVDESVQTIDDPGPAGGHFDFDFYFPSGNQATVVSQGSGGVQVTNPVCAKTTEVNNEVGEISPTWCGGAIAPVGQNFDFMVSFTTGAACGTKKAKTFIQTITCGKSTTTTQLGSFGKRKSTHEYDDKYDVTGVNMLNASDTAFNLVRAIPATTTPFKVLVMNQFLNPAATITIGPGSALTNATPVKTYGNLASSSSTSFLAALPIYTRGTSNGTTADGKPTVPITNLIFNLPLNTFQSKDWWGTGGDGIVRSGLISSTPGCVHAVNADGSYVHPGQFGERANGALLFQIIKHDTPESALELNHSGGDIRYGWRVKAGLVTTYVLAEYTAFWHHSNCYGSAKWIPNPELDTSSTNNSPASRAPGSADPLSPISSGLGGNVGNASGTQSVTVVSQTVNAAGDVTTTYSDGTVTIDYIDGSSKVTLSDGTVLWRLQGIDTGGVVNTAGLVNLGGVTTPPEALGRINWREVRR